MGKEDNQDVVVLPAEVFINLAGSEQMEELDMHSQINMSNLKNEEMIRRWANTYQIHQENSTWWKDEVLVVASDNNLKRGVISAFHNPPYHCKDVRVLGEFEGGVCSTPRGEEEEEERKGRARSTRTKTKMR